MSKCHIVGNLMPRLNFVFQLSVEVAKAADVPFPPPLNEGVTEEMHSLYIATPPPTPTPEVIVT